MRPGTIALALLLATSAAAQHDITYVEPAPESGAIATPIPTDKRRFKKYEIPELAGAAQALGPQLIDGRLPKPLIDFITADGGIEQRISIFEGGLVVVKMTGAATIRKKVLIPEDALQSYLEAISPEALAEVDARSLIPPERDRRAHLRIYGADGSYVERFFHPGRVLPQPLGIQLAPLRDLLRVISEDRSVTSSLAGYEPKAGDELVADDQKNWRVKRVIDGAGVIELQCLDAPITVYVAKKDIHLYFIGAAKRTTSN